MDEFWKWATYLLLIFAFVAVLTRSAQFARVAGTLFGGLTTLGSAIGNAGKS